MPKRKPAFKAHWDRPPLSIDFDGVIHKYSRGWVSPEIYDPPMEGAHESLRRLLKTHALHILTARDKHAVIAWCRKQFPDLRFKIIPDGTQYWQVEGVIGITNTKLAAIAYVDDRGLRFTNWRDIINYFQ
jgi:hypothetical protein